MNDHYLNELAHARLDDVRQSVAAARRRRIRPSNDPLLTTMLMVRRYAADRLRRSTETMTE